MWNHSHRLAACALIASLFVAPLSGVVHAAEPGDGSTDSPPSTLLLSSPSTLAPFVTPPAMERLAGSRAAASLGAVNATAAEQRGYGFRRGRGRRSAAAAALMIGAAAAITGTALLVYANRPECSTNVSASGCSYGAKVVGGSVLAGGVVGVAIGAALW